MSCLGNDPYYVNSPVMNLSVRYFISAVFYQIKLLPTVSE